MNKDATEQTFSFIIPVLNGERFVGSCLDSIVAEMHEKDELMVLDNGSTDRTVDIVRQCARAKLVEIPGSTIGALRNRGAEATGGDLLAFIDSDCLICEGWRAQAVSVLSDKSVHATGSRYDIPQPPHWIEKAWYSKKLKELTPVTYINSGNLVVRREIFEAVGGFDEKLITDEDYDLGERLNRAGFAVVEAPQVRAIHLGNPKSLWNFYKKEKWHATSSLNSLSKGRLDKPTAMTIAFMVCCLAALLALPQVIAGKLSLGVMMLLVAAVPTATAAYRIYQFKVYRQFLRLVILYAVFYLARALTILQFLFRRIVRKAPAETTNA